MTPAPIDTSASITGSVIVLEPRPGGQRPPRLLRSKLQPPRQRPKLVARPALVARLEEGLWGRLTVVSAAAGSGKSTLLSQWRASSEHRVGWLTLDERDRDPARFVVYLLAAARTVFPELSPGVAGLLASPAPIDPLAVLETELLQPLADNTERAVLVLDDLHLAESDEVAQILDWLVVNLPPDLHLMISSRVQPRLTLSRLRATDEVHELTTRDLSLGADESASFLTNIMSLSLDEGEVGALVGRFEGHAAALQLSAVSLRKGTPVSQLVAPRADDHSPLAQFLADDVLDNLPDRLQAFLHQVSILRTMNAALCEAVTHAPDAAALLRQAESDNLFLVPVPGQPGWFRIQSFLADILKLRLQAEHPAERSALHQRASAWFDGAGDTRSAIEHALAAGDPEWTASRFLGWLEALMRQSDLGLLRTLLDSLPDGTRDTHPWVGQGDGWLAVLTGDPAGALVAMARSEAALARADLPTAAWSDAARDYATGSALSVRAFAAVRLGDPARSIALADRALTLLGPDQPTLRAAASLCAGYAHVFLGQLEPALAHEREARALATGAGAIYTAVGAIGHSAWILRLRGDLRGAERLCVAGEALLDEHGCGQLPAAGAIHKELAAVHHARHCLPESLAALDQASARYAAIGDTLELAWLHRSRARVLASADRFDEAAEAVARARTLAEDADRPDLVQEADIAAAWVDERAGHHTAVARWAATHPENEDIAHSADGHDAAWLRMRVALRDGDRDGVSARAEEAAVVADRDGRLAHALAWRLLKLRATAPLAPAAATHTLQALVEKARRTGLLDVFSAEADTITRLLPHVEAHTAAWLAPVLPSAPAPAAQTTRPPRTTPQLDVPPLLEPLSPREQEVMALLAQGLSNRAIAQELFVGVGTIKTHVHRILGKLGAANRTEAAARARALGLVYPG
jgi:LuxR family transcriptional regulator, maltose regulon positive regulatory protein